MVRVWWFWFKCPMCCVYSPLHSLVMESTEVQTSLPLQNYIMVQESSGLQDKKRVGSPLLSPPGGKKPNLDDEGKKRETDDTRRWQVGTWID